MKGYRADRVIYDEIQYYPLVPGIDDVPITEAETIAGDELRELMQEWWHGHD